MKNLPIPLIALALSAFAIGTTEFVITDDQGHTLYFGERRFS